MKRVQDEWWGPHDTCQGWRDRLSPSSCPGSRRRPGSGTPPSAPAAALTSPGSSASYPETAGAPDPLRGRWGEPCCCAGSRHLCPRPRATLSRRAALSERAPVKPHPHSAGGCAHGHPRPRGRSSQATRVTITAAGGQPGSQARLHFSSSALSRWDIPGPGVSRSDISLVYSF